MSKRTFILLLILFTVSLAFCAWTVDYIEDEMTGEKTWFAASPLAFPTRQLSFPYQNTTAYLFVFYRDGQDLPVITFDPMLNIKGGIIYKDGFLYTTRVKWDNNIENIKIFKRLFADSITFIDPAYVVKRIRSSNTMLLELDWIGIGRVYFKFDLTGASKAIDQLHAKYK